MSVQAKKAPMTADTQFEPATVNVRIKISALWTAMLFVWVYVDLYRYYRADYRAEVEAGELGPFSINQGVLLGITVYIAIAALMIFLSLVLPARGARIANITLSVLYAATIIGGAMGEWYYYVFGSAVEVTLLAAIAFYAWTWPKVPASGSADRAEAGADHLQHTGT